MVFKIELGLWIFYGKCKKAEEIPYWGYCYDSQYDLCYINVYLVLM